MKPTRRQCPTLLSKARQISNRAGICSEGWYFHKTNHTLAVCLHRDLSNTLGLSNRSVSGIQVQYHCK